MPLSRHPFITGILATLPLVVAAFPFGLVFGAMAHSQGLTFGVTAGMSAIVFAGASQFIAITLLASASALPIIVVTVFIVNLRQMLYSANLMPYTQHWPGLSKAILAFALTDETFAVTSNRIAQQPDDPGLRWYYAGSAAFMYTFWQIATILGFYLGSRFPALAGWGLDVAMIVAFIGIVTPQLRRRADWACALTSGFSAYLTYDWPHQTGLLFTALLAIGVGLLVSQRSESHRG